MKKTVSSIGATNARALCLVALSALLVAGCSEDNTIAEQARAGTDKNYIAGDG
ncbi:hypothetical protein BH23ACT6_BH23ACT6_12700 [soil metagenome]